MGRYVPYVFYRGDGVPHGTDPALVRTLAKEYGFRPEFRYVHPGAEDPETGEWTGRVGEVHVACTDPVITRRDF